MVTDQDSNYGTYALIGGAVAALALVGWAAYRATSPGGLIDRLDERVGERRRFDRYAEEYSD